LAQEIRISSEKIKSAFTNSSFAEKVKADIHEAHTLGVSGVPFFVFNNKYEVSGAQPIAVFQEVLETVLNEQSDIQVLYMHGSVCTPDENC